MAADWTLVQTAGGRRSAVGLGLVLFEQRFSDVDLSLLVVTESTRQPFSSQFEPAAAFAGGAAEARLPFYSGAVRWNAVLRASAGVREQLGTPMGRAYEVTWFSRSAALLLAPSLECQVESASLTLTAGLGYRLQVAEGSAANLGGLHATLGLGLPTFAGLPPGAGLGLTVRL